MSKRKVLAFLAAFSVAIPLALSGAAGATVGSQTTGITSSEIKVGGLIESQFAGGEIGAKARFDEENAKGGVNGRKFSFTDITNYKQGDTAGRSPRRSGSCSRRASRRSCRRSPRCRRCSS